MAHRDRQLIIDLTSRTLLCEDALIADRPSARVRAIFGKRTLAPGDGRLLQPASHAHTAFMRKPVDAVFLDRNHQVVRLAPHVQPWHVAHARGATAVLELGDGQIERQGIALGHQLASRDATTPLVCAPWRLVDPQHAVERLLAAIFTQLGG